MPRSVGSSPSAATARRRLESRAARRWRCRPAGRYRCRGRTSPARRRRDGTLGAAASLARSNGVPLTVARQGAPEQLRCSTMALSAAMISSMAIWPSLCTSQVGQRDGPLHSASSTQRTRSFTKGPRHRRRSHRRRRSRRYPARRPPPPPSPLPSNCRVARVPLHRPPAPLARERLARRETAPVSSGAPRAGPPRSAAPRCCRCAPTAIALRAAPPRRGRAPRSERSRPRSPWSRRTDRR